MKTITIEIPDGKKAEWVNGVLTLVDDKPQDPNEKIPTFADAIMYLGLEKDGEDSPINWIRKDEAMIKKVEAYTKLQTIATAWNKIDGFVADWEDTSQYKYFPWFEYSRASARFMSAGTYISATYASVVFGSCLCFKTRERAIQFGKQFIDLWNDFLR